MRVLVQSSATVYFLRLAAGMLPPQTASQHVRTKQQSHRARGATALWSPTGGPGRGGAAGALERGALAEQSEKV